MQTGDKPRLLLDSLVLGVIGGLSAQLFTWLLRLSAKLFLVRLAGYTPPDLPQDGGVLRQAIGPHGLWLIPVATTLGGLISGAIVYNLAPETEGHGTDTVVKALHWIGGTIRARVAPVKMIASAITIGSGGSAGREGPTALIAAAFGSIYGTLLKRPERERRLMVLMGMAAGLSAIFRSPIGTAIFAVEVLYSGMEFEAEALLYCMLAAIVAYAVNGAFVGWQPLFQVPPQMAPMRLVNYGWYSALGVASGIVATLLPEVFYRMRDAFLVLRIPASGQSSAVGGDEPPASGDVATVRRGVGAAGRFSTYCRCPAAAESVGGQADTISLSEQGDFGLQDRGRAARQIGATGAPGYGAATWRQAAAGDRAGRGGGAGRASRARGDRCGNGRYDAHPYPRLVAQGSQAKRVRHEPFQLGSWSPSNRDRLSA